MSMRGTIGAMRYLLPLLVFLSAAAVADLADDVRCREVGFSRAAEARDIVAFRSFIDADARFVASDVRRGVDEVAAAWAPFFAADGPAIRWRPGVVEVLDDGRLALSRGPYRVIATNSDGESVTYWGTFNSVWRLNEDGVWRVVFDADAVLDLAERERATLFHGFHGHWVDLLKAQEARPRRLAWRLGTYPSGSEASAAIARVISISSSVE